MTLYKLIKMISNILTPDTDAFYRYVLYTSDDVGGFLRTRFCRWDKPVQDKELSGEYKRVLVASAAPIKFEDLMVTDRTDVKLQVHYNKREACLKDAKWDASLCYRYIYIIDLQEKTYSMEKYDKKMK